VTNELKLLGLWAGVGLVVANMIGAGVFVTTGFMAQQMSPGIILLAWIVGAILALAGAQAYATVAELVPKSGGEYRYLSDLLHPALGYLAGWSSLLVGFAAPIAGNAVAAGTFVNAWVPAIDAKWAGAAIIVLITVVQIVGLRAAIWSQNVLAILKAALVLGFATVGLVAGSHTWPTWQPPSASGGFPATAFAGSLFFIAFAFSGWNGATYSAEEFREPKRDVPRATLIGCALVAAIYLVVNWVFVANLTPAQAIAGSESQSVTLGHLIAQKLIGDAGARIMSAVIVALLVSAISAMTFAGPRVYSSMARDRFLPRVFVGKENRPPVASVLLQSAMALVFTIAYQLQQTLQVCGAILSLFAALTVLALFKVRFRRADLPRPPALSLVCAGGYTVFTAWTLFVSFKGEVSCYLGTDEPAKCNSQPHLLLWISGVSMLALVAYRLTRTARPGSGLSTLPVVTLTLMGAALGRWILRLRRT
jgi:APA family basic amino acid/polyamine antiporter